MSGATPPSRRAVLPRSLRALSAGIVLAAAAALLPSAAAAPLGEVTAVTIGPLGDGANSIAAGPDGSMWFTDNGNNAIGRITPSGAVAFFPVPISPQPASGPGLFAIAAGPDGSMWFTGFYANSIGKVTMAGAITTYPLPIANGMPYGISAGPDGNVWFALDGAPGIGRITPAGAITLFPVPAPGSTTAPPIAASSNCPMCPYLIAAGPDDALWFTIPIANRIGRITVDGAVTTFAVPNAPNSAASSASGGPSVSDIIAGPDGALWFTQPASSQIGRMTTAGTVTQFPAPGTPSQLAPGPGGTLWTNLVTAGTLARITMAGAITPVPTAGSTPNDLAPGPDGSMWASASTSGASTGLTLQILTVGTGVGPIWQARIAGVPRPGSRLVCSVANTTGWSVASVRYQWLRGGRAIPGASGRSFTPGKRDVGAKVSCRASATFAPVLNDLAVSSPPVRVRR